MSKLRSLGILVAVQLVVFLVSLPGFGIETRSPSQYSAWAGPVFLVLTVLVFAFGFGALAMLRSRSRTGAQLGFAQGVAAIATNLLDFSHVGGPPPPIGPLWLGVIAVVVAVGEVGLALRFLRGGRKRAAPPTWAGPSAGQ